MYLELVSLLCFLTGRVTYPAGELVAPALYTSEISQTCWIQTIESPMQDSAKVCDHNRENSHVFLSTIQTNSTIAIVHIGTSSIGRGVEEVAECLRELELSATWIIRFVLFPVCCSCKYLGPVDNIICSKTYNLAQQSRHRLPWHLSILLAHQQNHLSVHR